MQGDPVDGGDTFIGWNSEVPVSMTDSPNSSESYKADFVVDFLSAAIQGDYPINSPDGQTTAFDVAFGDVYGDYDNLKWTDGNTYPFASIGEPWFLNDQYPLIDMNYAFGYNIP